jgi:hypothetical protein
MVKYLFLLYFLVSNSFAADFTVISITSDSAFNYFASLQIWLFIFSAPAYLLISLIKYVRKVL